MSFGEILRELRNEQKITMKQLGAIVGVTESAIGMYERNERAPNFEILESIADYFNVDMDYLLGRSKIRNKYEQEKEDITFDDFRFALYGEVKDLTDEQKEDILDFARFIKNKNK